MKSSRAKREERKEGGRDGEREKQGGKKKKKDTNMVRIVTRTSAEHNPT